MSITNLIKAADLDRWAGKLAAREKFPALVRRLVHATVEHPRLTQFPANDETGRRGWDGIVETEVGNAWVPAGLSVWEMGTSQNAQEKAEKDYAKRTAGPGFVNPAETSFIFVTPRKWEGKYAWREAKRSEGVWKKVIAFDSADIEEWLELAPSVTLWLAPLVERLPPAGIRDPLARWEDLASISSPSLTRGVFTAGREKMVDAFRQALAGPPQELAIAATSPQELVDFAYAVLAMIEAEVHDAGGARAIVVDSPEAWSQLVVTNRGRLFLIPDDHLTVDARMVAEAVRAGHSVLTARPYTSLREDSGTPRLPRAPRYEVQKALEVAGFGAARSERLAREAAGCLTVLVRRASRFSGQGVPLWAQAENATGLLPLLLLGGWSDRNDSDRALVERMTGEAYDSWRPRLTVWLSQPDGPLRSTEDRCYFASREESWAHLAPLLGRELLDRFMPLACDVLGENDPRFDLPARERYMAGIRNQVPKYSSAARAGIAETIVLLGVNGENTPRGSTAGSAWRASRLVKDLLGGDSGSDQRRWFSLAGMLPTLAEAAPYEFLDALATDLERDQPAVAILFADEDMSDAWFTCCLYTGVLWALQRLGWSRELLPHVALTLASLVKRDFHYRSSPTPGGILHDIFAVQWPHTEANDDERRQVLELLILREPAVAWDLVFALIPSGHGFIIGGDRPHWRDWGTTTPAPLTNADLWRQIDWLGEQLIILVQGKFQRWMQLLGEIRKLPPTVLRALLDWLKTPEVRSGESEVNLTDLWAALRKIVAEHRFYHTSTWALTREIVDELALAEANFAPADPAVRYRWLFEGGCWDAFGDMKTLPEQRKELEAEARRQAVKAILATGGLEKVLQLAEAVKMPGLLGAALAEEGMPIVPAELLPARLIDERSGVRVLARCYATDLVASRGLGFDIFALEDWPEEAVAEVLAVQPFSRRSWMVLRERRAGAESLYWQKAFALGGLLEGEDLIEAVEMLRRNGRVLDAADLLVDGIRRRQQPDWLQVADLIEEALLTLSKTDPAKRWQTLSLDGLCELIGYLQDSPAADPSRVASLEWHFLPVALHGPFRPKRLHGEMSSKPAFFVEVLSRVYPRRSTNASVDALPPDEHAVNLAEACCRLLKSWRQIPGIGPDGTIESSMLLDWLAETRRLCREAGRAQEGDREVGELLSRGPAESDGSWPCIPVRDALESGRSEELLTGFELGVLNSRGIVSRDPYQGGDKERELKAMYSARADHCCARWPFTARVLRCIAEYYDELARREDGRADALD